MNYLQAEWENYKGRKWRSALVILTLIEDVLRWLNVPWQALRPIFFLRGRLTEGRNRRLLRRFVRQWAKNGYQSQDYFYNYDHRRIDRDGDMLVVTVEWKPDQRH